jgi:phenylalanyl-tRNA synthetase beta chain
MKISYAWLKQFIDTDKTPEGISLILTDIGLEVESLEKVQSVPGGLEGLVIGLVKETAQHPNADRLKITKVDAGTGEELQIVCGANNVAAGQKVVVALDGTKIYPTNGEPFTIKNSKIRGEVSQGMICAEDEIGLGTDHDGIMVLAADAQIGTPAKDYFKLEDDYLFEIGLTPNRADAASHLGVARDLAAYLRSSYTLPDVSGFKTNSEKLVIPVKVEDTASCPRYTSLSMTGVTVKESPDWLKNKLNVIGVRPINNVVDVTNYVLHELGQPLHAFDADQISGAKVVVKKCAEGTPFTTLDEVERKLSEQDLMICNAEGPMCMAGVFGGIKSGVSNTTKNIFLESAYFNPVSVRKTSKRHGLKTDASFRFERGTDPEMTLLAIKRAALLIQEVGGGEIASPIADFYPEPVKPFEISLSFANVSRLIGKQIDTATVKSIISALQIDITKETADGLELKVPAYRVDVIREVDVIEEILRIYGYNNVEIPSQIRASLNYSAKPDKEAVQNQVAEWLSANGFFEILANSLTSSAYALDADRAVRLLNPLSSDLDTMRQTLLFSGLEAVVYNQNRKNADLKFYEFGKTYFLKGEETFQEQQRLSVFMTGRKNSPQWNHPATAVNFYQLKAVVDGLVKKLNIQGLQTKEAEHPGLAYGLSYFKGEKPLASFGAVAARALKKMDIDGEVFYAEMDWDLIIKSIRNNKITYREVSKFPAVKRDLSLLVDRSVSFETLRQISLKTERQLLKEVNVFDVYQGDKLPSDKKSYALSFVLQDEEKTLTDKQIDAIMQKLMLNLEKEAGASVRK